MQFLSTLLGIAVSRYNLFVLTYAAVCNCAVNLDQVLINHAAGTDVEVTYLRVSHLTIRKTDILTAGQKLCVRIVGVQIIHIGSGCVVNYIGLGAVTYAPAVKNH